MRNSFFAKRRILSVSTAFFLMLFIISCGAGNGAAPSAQWGVLPDPDYYILSAFGDFTPEGSGVFFTGEGTDFYSYAFPTSGEPDGHFNILTDPPGSISSYSTYARYGVFLYTAQSNLIYRYYIGGNSWSTVRSGLPYSFNMSQTTADEDGYIYAQTTNGDYFMKYDTIGDSVSFVSTPVTFPVSEPRAAWDSETQRVYVADYTYTYLYAYNPDDDSFTELAEFPDSNGVSDAFCSDRRGHIYTTSGNGSLTDVYMYTASTDTWTTIQSLPFAPGNSAACTVSDDGYLYIANGSTQEFARLKIF